MAARLLKTADNKRLQVIMNFFIYSSVVVYVELKLEWIGKTSIVKKISPQSSVNR